MIAHDASKNAIARQMIGFIDLFKPHCRDTSTLKDLRTILLESHRWDEAHDLFSRIRGKTIASTRDTESYQYSFEEICAKTIYNLSDVDDPFDEDSPYWVVPFALHFAKKLGIDAAKVQDIVLSNPG